MLSKYLYNGKIDGFRWRFSQQNQAIEFQIPLNPIKPPFSYGFPIQIRAELQPGRDERGTASPARQSVQLLLVQRLAILHQDHT